MKVLFLQKDPFVNLGVMSLSAYLKKHGHPCELLIENAEKDFFGEIKTIKPGLIAFSCTTGIHTWAIKTAAKIKRMMDVPIIMGGHHPTFYPEVINSSPIDIICKGDGEEAILELVEKMEKNKSITGIKNLYVKKKDKGKEKVYVNPLGNLVENLDNLPVLDRSLYKRYPFIMRQGNYRTITGRGCPYNCTFCFNKSIKEMYAGKGRYVRRRSISNVIEELVWAKNNFKISSIDFQDDTFVYDFKNWLEPFLKEYKEKINLPFTCCVRANLIDEELARALKRYGCHSVKMGIESGNDYLNNQVLGKNLTKKQIADAVRYLKQASLKIEVFNIIGVPEESLATALETWEFNIQLGVDFARCSLLQPYPKTQIEQYAKDKGYLDKNFNLDTFENSYFIDTPIKLKNKKEIINIQRLFNVGVRFPFLFPLLKMMIKLPNNLFFDTIFKIDYAFSIFTLDKVSLTDFIALGMRSKGFFKK